MTVAFYMDEHIPRPITLGLRLRAIDVLTVQEDSHTGFPDPVILDRATVLQRVVFTQDDDFLVEAHRRQIEGIHFAGVIYAHQRNVSIGGCIQDLELLAKAVAAEDLINCVQYLPL